MADPLEGGDFNKSLIPQVANMLNFLLCEEYCIFLYELILTKVFSISKEHVLH